MIGFLIASIEVLLANYQIELQQEQFADSRDPISQ